MAGSEKAGWRGAALKFEFVSRGFVSWGWDNQGWEVRARKSGLGKNKGGKSR